MSNMTWSNLLNAKRMGNLEAKEERGRSPFLSDYDKLIFSGAFRRLARKTQVHPLNTHDMVHNRMTHSLEVASVGRTLAVSIAEHLKAKDRFSASIFPADIGDIVQSACLAHDIGNPAFGHAGERAIQTWFKTQGLRYLEPLSYEQRQDFFCFNGNAQGFRILTNGTNFASKTSKQLTYATLSSFIKYPWSAFSSSYPQHKCSIFNSEMHQFNEVSKACGLLYVSDRDAFSRHPLSYIVEAADDFCYALLDLEDGLMMGLIQWHDFYSAIEPLLSVCAPELLPKEIEIMSDKSRVFSIRGITFDIYIAAATKAFIEHEHKFLSGRAGNDLISLCPEYVIESITNAKELAKQKIFSNKQKVNVERKAHCVLSLILEYMMQALLYVEKNDQSGLDLLFQCQKRILADIVSDLTHIDKGDRYQLIHALTDYVSGMTDNYAVSTYLDLLHVREVA